MRGSRISFCTSKIVIGIIPAHAGLTLIPKHDRLCPWDHPRACGAHSSLKSRRTNTTGSSPRMRGSLLVGILIPLRIGIIPAHAGLTTVRTLPTRTPRDHPRACGAHNNNMWYEKAVRGSSPRMRGSQLREQCDAVALGIIPAHAGLTTTMKFLWVLTRDHPRACGAHQSLQAKRIFEQGSSPRMRGSRLCVF